MPADDAPCTKKRFGHVGPGNDENQKSQIANSRASALITGNCDAVSRPLMMSARWLASGRPVPSLVEHA